MVVYVWLKKNLKSSIVFFNFLFTMFPYTWKPFLFKVNITFFFNFIDLQDQYLTKIDGNEL